MVNAQIKSKEQKIETLRCMTQMFWERWNWELEKRKEALWLSKSTSSYQLQSTEAVKMHVSEIDSSLLTNPVVNDKLINCYWLIWYSEANDVPCNACCVQVFEAVDYLHSIEEILHNDITTSNVLLGPPTYSQQYSSTGVTGAGNYQILLIDFGKATKIKNGRTLYLSTQDKLEYRKSFLKLHQKWLKANSIVMYMLLVECLVLFLISYTNSVY